MNSDWAAGSYFNAGHDLADALVLLNGPIKPPHHLSEFYSQQEHWGGRGHGYGHDSWGTHGSWGDHGYYSTPHESYEYRHETAAPHLNPWAHESTSHDAPWPHTSSRDAAHDKHTPELTHNVQPTHVGTDASKPHTETHEYHYSFL